MGKQKVKQGVLSLIGGSGRKKKKKKGKKEKKEHQAVQPTASTTMLLEHVAFWGIADILGTDLYVSLVGQMTSKFRPDGTPVHYTLVYYQILEDSAYCVFQMGSNAGMLICCDGSRSSVVSRAFIAYAEINQLKKAIDEYEDALALGGYVFDDTLEGLKQMLYIKCPAVFELDDANGWVRMEVKAND